MLSSIPAQFTNDFLPIIFFMDFSQDRLLSTVFAYDNEKKPVQVLLQGMKLARFQTRIIG
jgi:hypothetical protein